MSTVQELYDKGFRCAEEAIDVERRGDRTAAISLYEKAIAAFQRLAIVESTQKRKLLTEKIKEFKEMLARLQQDDASSKKALLKGDALYESARKSGPDTIGLLMQAAESYLEALKFLPKAEHGPLKQKVEGIIDEVTRLKAFAQASASSNRAQVSQEVATGMAHRNKRAQNAYTSKELDVLRRSSTINGRIFLPWMDIDVGENLNLDEVFIDPDGLLSLSPKQSKYFVAWRRPHMYNHNRLKLTMIEQISPFTITQDIVTDCSFVASLCITAAYEQRFRKQLITRIIYPQDSTGKPTYNRAGKYLIKLWINGVPRKVIVDDKMPLDKNGKLLCSYTTCPNELWVSIIEKAYMKVNGGYDFPGSNSGIDLFALTGWIPESLTFDQDGSDRISPERIWQRLMSAHRFGDCLITIATGDMADAEAKELGLVSMHAYAVLDVVEISGYRLLQVKNPWRKKRWKGPFSAQDSEKWTRELCQSLNFNPAIAMNSDDGLFWIDFESITRHFRGLFLNWNPELFSYRTTLHKHWSKSKGPRNDTYNVGFNPQYTLRVKVKKQSALAALAPTKDNVQSIWILLTRHVTGKIGSEAREQDYLTLHVYTRRKGQRVYYPIDAYIRGTYSNNPHNLTCIDVPEGDHNFTLVASQYEKIRDIDYTISVFSTAPFRLSDTSKGPPKRHRINSEWNTLTAGGSPPYGSYMVNPQWELIFTKEMGPVLICLEAPGNYPVNIRLMQSGKRISSLSQDKEVASSGDYRPGFCYFEIDKIPEGRYTVIPSTFNPDSIGEFTITIAAPETVTYYSIPQEGDGLVKTEVKGRWSTSRGTAAGCNNFERYIYNPRYLLTVPQSCNVTVRLQSIKMDPPPALNISIYQSDSSGQVSPQASPSDCYKNGTSNAGVYVNSPSGVVISNVTLPSGTFALVPSTFNPTDGSFRLIVYSSKVVNLHSIIS